MNKKEVIKTDLAPAAVGTYSQGVKLNQTFYFSGQIGLDPKSGDLKKTFDEQLKQILSNVDGLLKSCHLQRSNIIKTTIFMVDLKNFGEVNTAYEEYFTAPYPARSTVQVSALPKGALIEIEVLAAE